MLLFVILTLFWLFLIGIPGDVPMTPLLSRSMCTWPGTVARYDAPVPLLRLHVPSRSMKAIEGLDSGESERRTEPISRIGDGTHAGGRARTGSQASEAQHGEQHCVRSQGGKRREPLTDC